MGIKLTTQEALDIVVAINRLPKLPVKASYRLSRIADKLRPEAAQFEKQRAELVKEFGTSIPDQPDMFKMEGEAQENYNKALKELSEIEIECPLEPVKLSDLGDKADIEPSVLSILDKVILDA